MILKGIVDSAGVSYEGSQLATDHPVGATVLDLRNLDDFGDEGLLVLQYDRGEGVIDPVPRAYVFDEATGSVVIDEPLDEAAPAETEVLTLTDGARTEVRRWIAVDLGEGDTVKAAIPTVWRDRVPLGSELQGSLAEVESLRAGGYRLHDLPVEEPPLDLSGADVGTLLHPRIELVLPVDVNIPHNTTTPLTTMVRGWSAGFGPWSPDANGWVRIDRSAEWIFELFEDWAPQSDGHRLVYLQRLDLGGNVSTMRLVRGAPADNGFVTVHFTETIHVNEGDWVRMAARQSSGATLAVKAGSTTMKIRMAAVAS